MEAGVVIEPREKTSRDWSRDVAIALASVLIALGSSWVAFARSAVDEPQVRQIVADRVEGPVLAQGEKIDELVVQVVGLREQVARLEVEVQRSRR